MRKMVIFAKKCAQIEEENIFYLLYYFFGKLQSTFDLGQVGIFLRPF